MTSCLEIGSSFLWAIISNISAYLSGFLGGFSPYAVCEKTKDGYRVKGYADFISRDRFDGERVLNRKLHPRLSISVNKIKGKEEEIKKR